MPGGSSHKLWVWVVYGLMIVGTILVFLMVRAYGESLPGPTTVSTERDAPVAAAPKVNILFHVLLALAAVIALGQLLGWLFRHMGQPPVIGEVVAGILLGPSLLGWVSPEASAFLLPSEAAPYLGVIAQFGVILYMFIVGLELNAGMLRRHGHSVVAISHASIVLPFVLGAILALGLYGSLAGAGVPFTSFALFLGVAMSITAFPVLARILTDRRMSRTELGVLALVCAAVGDVTAWCLLAFVVGVAQAQVGGAVQVMVLTAIYIGFLFLVVRPAADWLARHYEGARATRGIVALVFLALLMSSLTTELIGIHAIFGAFVLGAVLPHDSALARDLTRKLEDLVTVVLLPAFFAFTGMRTEIGLVSGLDQWLVCGLIILVATVGKFGGALAAARLTGIRWRPAAALGVLMNTRGLMELIVLNVGLDLKVISPTLFAMMVLMALVTTMATTPILQLLVPGAAESSRVEQARPAEPIAHGL